jgi:hypothetical protein
MRTKIVTILIMTLLIVISLEGATIAIYDPILDTKTKSENLNEKTNSKLKSGLDGDPFELALMEITPIQVIKGSGIIRPDIWDTSLGIKIGKPDLVENKKTLIEIWYFLYSSESIETTVTVKIYDSNGALVKEIQDLRTFDPTGGGFLKLEPWIPLPTDPLIYEIKKPNVEIEVELGPAAGDIELNNNKLKGEFEVKKSNLSILYTRVGRNNSDLTTLLQYATTARVSREFIEGTYPVPFVPISVTRSSIIQNGAPGKLPYAKRLELYRNISKRALGNGYDRGVGIIKKGWIFNNFQGVDNFWKGTVGVCIPSIYGVLSEVGRISTPAHEIGHTYGLYVGGKEEYELINPGNPTIVYWVAKKNVSPHELQKVGYCFMGYASPQWNYFIDNKHVWIDTDCYTHLYNRITKDPEIIVVDGTISENRGVKLFPWYHLLEGNIDVNIGETGNYSFVYLNEGSQEIGRAGFNVSFYEKGNQSIVANLTAFVFRIPWLDGTKEIQIRDQGENILASRSVSENSPVVTVNYPNGGETLIIGDNYNITWDANDQDGDDLTYSLSYSNDSGETWFPIDIDFIKNYYIWDTQWCTPGNEYLIRVRASDDINIGEDISDGTFSLINSPPSAPTISGPGTGKPNTDYDFTLNSVDPDGDDVRFIVDWGDGDSETTSFTTSGNDLTVSHMWTEQGTYSICVYAEDEFGALSITTTVQMIIEKSKTIYNPFLIWLQSHPNMFPILQQLIMRFGLQ